VVTKYTTTLNRDYDASTSRTDRQVRQTTCRSNTALCIASRGNNSHTY